MADRARVTVRTARAGDASVLADLASELGYPTTTSDMVGRLASIDGRPDHAAFVAELDSIVVAWIHLCVMQSLETPPFAEIRGLVVTEAQRGRGIGAELVRTAERWATEKTCRKIRVRSNAARDDARRFYQNCGYDLTKSQNVFEKGLHER